MKEIVGDGKLITIIIIIIIVPLWRDASMPADIIVALLYYFQGEGE